MPFDISWFVHDLGKMQNLCSFVTYAWSEKGIIFSIYFKTIVYINNKFIFEAN